MTRTSTLHFTITGEFCTMHARRLWASENRPDQAFSFLKKAFPTMDEATQTLILTGKKKMMGENDKCYLANDNATEDCNGELLGTVESRLGKLRAELKEKEYEEYLNTCERVSMSSPWGKVAVPVIITKMIGKFSRRHALIDGWSWDRFEARFPDLVEDAKLGMEARKEAAKDLRRLKKIQEIQEETYRRIERQIGHIRNTVSEFRDGLSGSFDAATEAILHPPTECPEPDKAMESMNGWLNAEGVFYPCGFMGHDNLAYLLGKEVKVMERSWVKIQDHADPRCIITRIENDFPHIPDRGITQAQLNAMQRWCVKHKRTMPKDLDVR